MRKQCILSITCIIFNLFFSYAQILTVVEKSNGRQVTIDPNSAQIIDINSNLEISISKNELIDKIRTSHPELSDQLGLQERINALEIALDNQESILTLLQQKTLNKSDKEELYGELKSFYSTLLQQGNEDLRTQVGLLFLEWRKIYGRNSINLNSGVRKEVYIFSNLNNDLSTAKDELSRYKGGSVMISMIAFVHNNLGKNRVHIENFDTITESDIYTVPRWVTSLSEDQEKKLKELQKRADDYNKEALQYFDNFKAELLSKLPDLSCVKALKAEIEGFISDPSLTFSIKVALKNDVDSITSEIDGFSKLLEYVTQDISTWTIQTPFKILDNVNALVNDVKNLEDVFEKFTQTAAEFDSIMSRIDEIRNSFKTCYKNISDDINGFTSAMSILKNQQNRFKDNDEIGDEVKKFTINTLPSAGYLKLKRSGPRDSGDDLEIVLVLRVPKNGSSIDIESPLPQKNEVIESHLLNMQLIGLHSETAVGMIMADSFNENGFTPIEDRRFLYSPSVALLLKVGSRNSRLYNDFVDLGFGLAISTPDFNTDGTPEFGAGFMLTAFKDILSIGINYNVTLDTPYWSFGINLPFNLPGIPINKPN